MKKIIKNGKIVSSGGVFSADLLIEDEIIKSIGQDFDETGADIIDATGNYVLPGAVDVHTHMDLDVGFSRAVDDFYTGTVAAACGGTTSIVDHMAFGPEGIPLHYQFDVYKELATGKSVVDYGFHGTVQHVNDEIIKELETMKKDGIPSVKVYLTYGFKLNDAEVYRILVKMKELGGITAFHCENHEIVEFFKQKYKSEGKLEPIYHAKSRPNEAEAEAVCRILHIAHLAKDAPVYIVHLSCKESLLAVREARARGQKNIYVETCPQYLVLTEEKYLDKDGLKYIMSPPLRTKEDCDALWEGIEDGTIDVVATDHCPFRYGKEKQLGASDFTACPNGAPGVEERLLLMYSEGVAKGRITMERLVEIACKNPCKIYGVPKKGELIPNADADIVILNPDIKGVITKENLHGAADYTAYEGIEVCGKIETVMLRGNIIVKDNEFIGNKGDGKFLLRKIEA